jgi:hypothetical protein
VTARLTINGVDFTSKWRLYESRWTARAYMGESSQSEFVLDDDLNTIDHADLASRKIVEVWEDASGVDICMYRGRVANKSLGRGPSLPEDRMQWTVITEDSNIDVRGIRVDDSTRPEESDRERVLAYLAGYLNGASSTNPNARDSTDIDGTYVIAADLVTLPAETYTDTFPGDVFNRISEVSAKTWFVYVGDDGGMDLYYASHTDQQLVSDISITDNELDADGTDVYSPYLGAPTGEHDGQQLISGGSLRYGSDQFYEFSHAGSEADHDKWEEHFTDEYVINQGSAEAFLENVVASRNNEDFRYSVTIRMRVEEAHRIKAGMYVPIRLASANLTTESDQRAVQVQHEPLNDDWYLVNIEFGVPRGRPFRRNIRTKPGPFEPTPTEPPGPETPGASSWSYTWDFEDDNLDTTNTVHFMRGRINSPGALSTWWGDSGGGTNDGLYERQAVTAGGSINVEGSFAKRRLTTTSVSWFKILWFDTMLAVNEASSTTIGIGASGTGPGVIASVDSSTTVPAGIVGVEIQVDDNLTADNLTISHTAAATPGTPGTPGNGLPEIIGDDNIYARADHQHYVLREAAPTITDDEEHGYPVGTEWRVVDDVDNPTVIYERWFLLDNTDGAAVWVIDTTGDAYTVPYGETTVGDYLDELAADVGDTVVEHGTTGASEDIDLADGLAHNATLGANTTFTFSGASSGEESRFRLYMRQDATGSRVPTFPASVVWPDDTEPTWSTAAGDVDVIEFSSIDGGVTWFGDAGGGASAGGATDLDGLTDVVITAPAEGDMLRFNGTNWVNTPGRWEPVTTNPGGGPELVWDGDELLMTWVDT